MGEHTAENDAPCNVCGTTDESTFEAGGVWWCSGCAAFITDEHLREDRRPPGKGGGGHG